MALFNLMARLGLDTSSFQAGMKRSESSVTAFSRNIGVRVKSSLAAAFSIGAITALTRSTVQAASQINDLAIRLGVSTDALQEFGFAAKQNGADVQDFAVFLESLAKARARALGGDDRAISDFKDFGIAVEQLKDARLQDLARQVGSVFKTGDPQKFIDSLQRLGGRGAGGLIPTFAAGLEESAQMAHALGQVIDEELIESLDALGDQTDILKGRFTNLWAEVVGGAVKGASAIMSFLNHLGGAAGGMGHGLGTFMRGVKAGEKVPTKWELLKSVFGSAIEGWKTVTSEEEVEEANQAEARRMRRQRLGLSPLDIEASERTKRATDSGFSGLDTFGRNASTSGLFLGADAALRLMPQRQLDKLGDIEDQIMKTNDTLQRLEDYITA